MTARQAGAVRVEVLGHPDKPVAAPCFISGCQYAEYSRVFDLAKGQAERIRELEATVQTAIREMRIANDRVEQAERALEQAKKDARREALDEAIIETRRCYPPFGVVEVLRRMREESSQ